MDKTNGSNILELKSKNETLPSNSSQGNIQFLIKTYNLKFNYCLLSKVKYKITVKTGSSQEAGTDSNVSLEIFGKNGATHKIFLTKNFCLDKNADLFERGKIDIFEVEATNVGKVSSIKCMHFTNLKSCLKIK